MTREEGCMEKTPGKQTSGSHALKQDLGTYYYFVPGQHFTAQSDYSVT